MFHKQRLASAVLLSGGSCLLAGFAEIAWAGPEDGGKSIGVVVATDAVPASKPVAPKGGGSARSVEKGVIGSQVRQDELGNEFQTREDRRQVPALEWYDDAPIVPEDDGFDTRAPAPFGAVPGSAPSPSADEDAQHEFPDEWRALEEEPADSEDADLGGQADDFKSETIEFETTYGTVNTYTPYQPDSSTSYPWRAIGKLYFSTGGGSATCSASVISPNNVIVSAAHCCYDRVARRFNTNFQFVPSENNGAAPYGVFPATTARVSTGWRDTGARQHDVCVLNLGNNSARRSVTSYTGSLGRAWNNGSVLNLHAIGYPSNISSSRRQQLCTAESYSPSSTCGGTTVLNMGCNMTFGSSGGPWIWRYRSGNLVNSVVSGHDGSTCTGTVGQTFNGPRFTSNNIVPLCNAAGC